jgi:hypothetical protein
MCGVIVLQSAADVIGGNPHDCVAVGVEHRITTEKFDAQNALFKGVEIASERLLQDGLEKETTAMAPAELIALENLRQRCFRSLSELRSRQRCVIRVCVFGLRRGEIQRATGV